MRWWSIPIAVALVWFLFTLTPFWALYDLARAVAVHDADYVERHVNVRALRVSMTRQLTEAIRAGKEGDTPERRSIADAAAALAMPLAETLITPSMVIDLLDDGWPESLDLPATSAHRVEGLRIPDLRRLVALYLSSEMRGFGTVVIAVPPDRPVMEQFKIRMRIRNWSWHVVDIRLNQIVRERVASAIARAQAVRDRAPEPESNPRSER